MLFTPVTIGTMTVKNRFVRSATHDYLGHPDGSISDAEIELYKTLAQNEVGMIVTAHTYVQHPYGKAGVNQNAIYDDRYIEGYRRLAQEVQAFGCKLVVQISHAGRQTLPDCGFTPLAPSSVPEKGSNVIPKEMSEEEIERTIADFASAMIRVAKSGADGVQLHLAHGFLLSEFLSPYTNRRTDRWGGEVRSRLSIVAEIMRQAAKEGLGAGDFPVLVKMNATDGFDGPGYLSLGEVIEAAAFLKELGVAAIEVSGGHREAPLGAARRGITSPEKEAYFFGPARAIKEKVNIPVILTGGLRSRAVMEKVINEGRIDMVGMSRPFIQEPDLVVRFLNGQEKAACISCNGCYNPRGIRCSQIRTK
ncbi:MAG TPA: NADH:flavin oxidoreductase [Firmicutes bacterium]|nr:NADH:flavin oxidoreductase [Bacillota bacterium]